MQHFKDYRKDNLIWFFFLCFLLLINTADYCLELHNSLFRNRILLDAPK